MARKLKSDRVLFIATLLLVALSVVMVYSASAPMALDRYGWATRFLTTQVMWSVLGIAMLTVVMRIDYRHYRQPKFIWTGLALVVFALVSVYFRAPVNGARRWFGVGGIGVQPSELAKLVAIFFIAALLERRMHRIDEVAYALLPIGIVVLGMVALILPEPDFGTSMAILMITAVMIFAAGLNWRYIAGLALVGLPAIYIVVMGSAYRRRRTLAFLHPWDDPLGDGFQIIQSLIAIGHRRRLGQGSDERGAEAVLPPGAAHRLHLLGHLRGARAGRRHRGADLFLRGHVARDARVACARPTPSGPFWRWG